MRNSSQSKNIKSSEVHRNTCKPPNESKIIHRNKKIRICIFVANIYSSFQK